MAELSSTSKKSLWPTLKKKLVEAKKKTTRKKQKQNPFSSQGLEKFALMMAELQAKKASLVDKTGNSVSAVRYLSRSAQEWTATTLARTASRRREKLDLSPRSSEVLLLQQMPPPPDSHSKERVEIETIELSQSFSFPNPGHGFGFDSEVLVVGDLQREMNPVSTSQGDGDGDAAEDSREPRGDGDEQEEVGCSGKTAGLPANSARLIRHGRLLLLEKGWARSPNSALALLVALGACLGGRLMKFGNSVLEVLSINLVVRWQKGKVWADFLQSLVARHVVPHLSIRVPRGLALLPLIRCKISPEPDANPENSVARVEEQSEIESVQKPDPSSSFPVVPENSSLSSSDFPALATLHFKAEGSESSSSCSSIRTSSSTGRFVKKLTTKLKAKISKSSTSGSSAPGSPISPSSPSSPRRGSKFPFSRRDKEKEMSDDGWPDDEVFAESSKKRSILTKKCSFRKDKTPEPSTTRRSPLGRNFSSKLMEPTLSTDMTQSLHDVPSISVFDAGHKNFDLWLIVGLLVALLFLLVSRFSAIVATSLLFLVLSHAHRESSYYRMPRRDVDTLGRQSSETARKLHRNPGYVGRLGSPSREETTSNAKLL